MTQLRISFFLVFFLVLFGATQPALAQLPTDSMGIGLVDTAQQMVEVVAPVEEAKPVDPLITNNAIVFGILIVILGLVFASSESENKIFKGFYKFVPALLLCYFIPAVLNSLNIISGETAKPLYFVASRYLLPASLVLLTLSIDMKSIIRLGPKAGIMFLTGTAGIIIGGPLAILIVSIFSPETVGGAGPDEVWRGLSTIAGSWIGGGANQTAMKEVFLPSDKLFGATVAVDIIIANIWMGFLLYGAGISNRIDRAFKADSSAIDDLKARLKEYHSSNRRIPTLTDSMTILAVAFGVVALGHLIADIAAPWVRDNAPVLNQFSLGEEFFWLIVITTTGGLVLSFTKARNLESVGASRFGSLFLYVLVATIGMKMDIKAIVSNPGLFVVGGVWMVIHAALMLGVGRLIRAPFFFVAVGSQANVGGAASAPVVASAFDPSLAPVGVLLAVFGYALGTYGAWLCAIIMQQVAPVTTVVAP